MAGPFRHYVPVVTFERLFILPHTLFGGVASLVLDESMHIGVEFPLVFLHNGRDTSMGTKNNVIECLRVAW